MTSQRKTKLVRLSRRRRSKGKRRIKFSVGSIFLLGLFLLSFFTIGSITFVGWISRDLPDPEGALREDFKQSTKIYDRTGKTVLYEIFEKEKRTILKLEEIPDYVKWATVVIEDKDFFKHRGFDLSGMARALYVNIIRGGILQGGSTITQQLIKNTLLTNEKSFLRKIKELILAYRIEQKFSKEQILKMYLNEIPYGATAHGIEAAAETYFGISARDLELAESALLAALPKAPTRLSPYGSKQEELFVRQRHILDLMAEQGYITKDEAEAAKEEKLVFKPKQEGIIAPHFVMYVKELLAEQFSEQELTRGGLKVYTTLDVNLQEMAEEAVAEYAKKNEEQFQASNAALVALDGKTAEILVMVGSRDFFNEDIDGQVNVALRPRQPGSSFKPIVYAAAFEKGYTPETKIFDVKTVFKTEIGKDYVPLNYNEKERGPISLRSALAGSLNIPAVKLIYLTGINRVLDLAETMGYTTLKDRSRFGLSLVLGGGEVKLLEHIAAFMCFGQEGLYRQPQAILKIEDQDGKVLFSVKKKEGKRVVSTEIARLITDILSDNQARSFVFGSSSFLQLPDRPAAAKTGTTNDFRDAWTLGITPSLAAGVWVGNNDNSEMKKGADGSKLAAPIWQSFMKKALKGKPVELFIKPQIAPSEKPVLRGEGMGETMVKIDRASGKLATELTPESFVVEKKYSSFHSILHYLNKDDPTGPPPEDPTNDLQYENWEKAIKEWAGKQDFVIEEPPIEKDDLHVPVNFPSVTILEPLAKAKISSSPLIVNVEALAPRAIISRVEFYINGTLEGTLFTPPFILPINIENLSSGFHTMAVKAFDDIDNRGEASVTVNVVR